MPSLEEHNFSAPAEVHSFSALVSELLRFLQHPSGNKQVYFDLFIEWTRHVYPHWMLFFLQHALTRLSCLIWTAQSSTAPMPSSNTGIKSERKSAWILKSSLPPLMEDAPSTCWRSSSPSSPTGSVRKPSFFCPSYTCHLSESPIRNPAIIAYSWFSCRERQTGLRRSVKCSLSD